MPTKMKDDKVGRRCTFKFNYSDRCCSLRTRYFTSSRWDLCHKHTLIAGYSQKDWELAKRRIKTHLQKDGEFVEVL